MDEWDVRPSATTSSPATATTSNATGATRSARTIVARAVLTLRLTAAAIIAMSVIGNLINIATRDDYYGQPDEAFSFWYEAGQLMQQVAYTAGMAGVVLAAAALVQVLGLRLEHDALVASTPLADRPPPADPGGALTLQIPPRPLISSMPRPGPAVVADDAIWMPPGHDPSQPV